MARGQTHDLFNGGRHSFVNVLALAPIALAYGTESDPQSLQRHSFVTVLALALVARAYRLGLMARDQTVVSATAVAPGRDRGDRSAHSTGLWHGVRPVISAMAAGARS